MKTLNLNQMEIIEGGKPCTEEHGIFFVGGAVALTIFGGPVGAWAGAALLYSCVLSSNY